MSNPRIVVVAEGFNEVPLGDWRLEPRDLLTESHLGSAHVLVRRLVLELASIPEEAVQFEEPLKYQNRRARGSLLLKALPKLFRYPPGSVPTLAVVFVDQDGVSDRERKLQEDSKKVGLPVALGVAVREFEAWLIADSVCVAALAGALGVRSPSKVEKMANGAAKDWLHSVIPKDGTRSSVRMELATGLNLQTVRRECPSFERFCASLAVALSS